MVAIYLHNPPHKDNVRLPFAGRPISHHLRRGIDNWFHLFQRRDSMDECRIETEKKRKAPIDRKTLELVAIGASIGSGCDD